MPHLFSRLKPLFRYDVVRTQRVVTYEPLARASQERLRLVDHGSRFRKALEAVGGAAVEAGDITTVHAAPPDAFNTCGVLDMTYRFVVYVFWCAWQLTRGGNRRADAHARSSFSGASPNCHRSVG
jgi:hypothetical protein